MSGMRDLVDARRVVHLAESRHARRADAGFGGGALGFLAHAGLFLFGAPEQRGFLEGAR